MNKSLQKIISVKKKKKATPQTIKEAKKTAEEMKKIEGVKEVALIGSIAKGVPYSNLNYLVVIDSYSNKNLEKIKKQVGKGNSAIFITEKDLMKKAKKTKAGPVIKAVGIAEYLLDKNSKTETGLRKIIEEKLPRLRIKTSDPRLIQVHIPLTEEQDILRKAKEKQARKGIKNPIFQEKGFMKTVDAYLKGELTEKQFKRYIREEPKAREYLYRIITYEKNPERKKELEKIFEKIKIIK